MKPPFGPGGPNHSGTIEPRWTPSPTRVTAVSPAKLLCGTADTRGSLAGNRGTAV